jgi:glycosyltransferase involved in cell wall biosynthesis
MLRILLVEPDLEDNGALRVSLDRARRWSEAGTDTTVLFISDHDNGTLVDVPSSLHTVIANKGLKSARWMLPRALSLGWRLARSADVIVAGREIASGLLIGTLLAKVSRRPFAVTVHSNVERALAHHGTPRHRRNVLACFGTADALVPVSRGLVAGLETLGLPAAKINVVENGLDVARLKRMAGEESPITVPDHPFIMAIGRLTEQKGFDLLIEAHAEALKAGAPFHHVVIAGEGPDRDKLVQLAAELGVSSSVNFAGFLTNPFPVLRRATAFVLSSRWEGFSLALGEALALEVPSISADCIAGPAELLERGRYGVLVPVNDSSALAEAMTRHLYEPGRLAGMAKQGRHFIEDRYGAESAAARHLDVLKRLAGHRS